MEDPSIIGSGSLGMCTVAERDSIMRNEGEKMSSGRFVQAANTQRSFLHKVVRKDFSKLRLRFRGIGF